MDNALVIAGGVLAGGGGLISALLAVTQRRHYLVHVAMALYVTVALMAVIPQQWLVDATRTLAVSGGVFVAVLLAGPSLVWAVDEWRDYRVPWRYMLFGMAVFGMALSVILPLLAAAGVSVPGVTPAVAAVFTGPVARFAWMGAPLLTAVVVRKI